MHRHADDREAEADDEDRVVAPGRGREQAEGQQRAEHRARGVHRAVHAEGGAERLGVDAERDQRVARRGADALADAVGVDDRAQRGRGSSRRASRASLHTAEIA